MFRIPRRYSHFVYGFIQSGLICGIAAAIASFPLMASSNFVLHWLQAWLFSWLLSYRSCCWQRPPSDAWPMP